MDVSTMVFEVVHIPNPMISETLLPDLHLSPQPEGESTFDELHRAFQRNLRRGRYQRVKMVWHDHEFVKQKSLLVAVMEEHIEKKAGGRLISKNRRALPCDRGDKESPIPISILRIIDR